MPHQPTDPAAALEAILNVIVGSGLIDTTGLSDPDLPPPADIVEIVTNFVRIARQDRTELQRMFTEKRADAGAKELLDSIIQDLSRLDYSIDTKQAFTVEGARKTWVGFYEHVAELRKRHKANRDELEMTKAKAYALDQKILELTQNLTYAIQQKAEARAYADGMRAASLEIAMGMVEKVVARVGK